jgi:3-oxoacyl-[acyl-carrier protein] reductase
MNRIDLSHRTSVITGGAVGIGYATAERMLDSGAAASLWDRDADNLAKAEERLSARGTVRAVEVDVAEPQAVAAAAEWTVAELGRIDILVNNAGVAGTVNKLWETPVEEWRRVIDINLNSMFLCCRAVIPNMIENGYGRIVNVASIAGKEGNPNAAHYSTAKAGVIGLTKSLGKEIVDKGIIVNCITPAVIETPIISQSTPEHIAYMVARIPMGRMGRPEEVAALIAWLASEDCSFTTGAVFDISGGRATY